jgi:hypothetical protein
MRVIEAHEIGYDPALRPMTDVGTLSLTIVAPARSRQAQLVPKPRSTPPRTPSGRRTRLTGIGEDTALRRKRTIIVY